jgi:LPS sulfotransferase NodH
VGQSLLVATTPRSGSWLLSDYLAQTGVVGPAREYFHVNYVATRSGQCGLPTTGITVDYIDGLLGQAREAGQMFATKLHWLQINQLCTALRRIHPSLARAPAPQLIEASLPGSRYLYLTRRDKPRQAISMLRAMRSERWWQTDSSPPPREDRPPPAPEDRPRSPEDGPPPGPEMVPDYLSIRWFEDDLRGQDAEWRRYFATFGITVFAVVYEDLVADPRTIVRAILDWLGLPEAGVPELTTTLRRQADAETDRVLRDYLDLREVLPGRPPHWEWSFRRRAFGRPDEQAPPGGPPAIASPSMAPLSPF